VQRRTSSNHQCVWSITCIKYRCHFVARRGADFSEMSDIIGNVRYHRKNPIVMMSLLNLHAGNKFCSPEGLVLCHPVMLAEEGLRTCNSVYRQAAPTSIVRTRRETACIFSYYCSHLYVMYGITLNCFINALPTLVF
jgi:hypothetical protein